jgi:DNA-binding Lrp family transcriptional regulator
LENVFAPMGPQISSIPNQTQVSGKLKRSAFVFITAEADCCHSALADLRKIDEIEEVYLAKGAYDLIAKVNGESLDQLREVISKKIRNVSTVKSTLTLTLI